MTKRYAIIDLFAGPGGLAEGFSSITDFRGNHPFRIALSVEKEASAHQTLLLRTFLRQFSSFPDQYYDFINGSCPEPDWPRLFPKQWRAALDEALLLELGSPTAWRVLESHFRRIEAEYGRDTIVIGGPPCQAYSLVGRARNRGIEGYEASKDHRHFLYREYIRILNRLKPAAFVMENVKGMLSSSIDGERVFDKVLDDLSEAADGAYTLVPLLPRSGVAGRIGVAHAPAADFIIRAEDLGVPQARHRVIVVGIRKDVADQAGLRMAAAGLLVPSEKKVTVRDVLSGMPLLRSGLSDREDTPDNWATELKSIVRHFPSMQTDLQRSHRKALATALGNLRSFVRNAASALRRTSRAIRPIPKSCPEALRDWLADDRLKTYPNHETRSHMASDLGRYFFASLYASVTGTSPKASSFPRDLAPDHRNWKSGKFADRFRVQLWDQPATTVTSHISKDGHYFIHPDPRQCRSLTVREAARLQTFPDNYFFKGNRTQQYVQVGNAVPPFLARKIAESLHSILVRKTNPVEDGRQLKKPVVTQISKASR